MKKTTILADLASSITQTDAATKLAIAQTDATALLAQAATAPDRCIAAIFALGDARLNASIAKAAFAKIPAARRAAALKLRLAAELNAKDILRRFGGCYSGTTERMVVWGSKSEARTLVSSGVRYSRSCTYSKNNAKHLISLHAPDVVNLFLAPQGLEAASLREGLPLIGIRDDGRAVWVIQKRGKSLTTEDGYIAFSAEFGGTCYHSIYSRDIAQKGLEKKLRRLRQDALRAEEARRAYRFSPQGKAARRAALVARLCSGAVATIADARALGYCAPGIAAFQARHGIGDTASLPDLVRTGDGFATRLALDVARRIASTTRTATVAPATV